MAPATDLMSTLLADAARARAYEDVESLAEWSGWAPLLEVLPEAPRRPGVYLLREPGTGVVRFVGAAGERAGGGGRPQGLYGRLSAYRTGQGSVSGFDEAALDLALADPDWVEARLVRLRGRGPERTRDWVRSAVERLAPEVCWSAQPDAADARLLEQRAVQLLRPYGLWGR